MNKGSPDAVSSAMKDHTIRRMYTKRASGDINIYAMKENLTTQEISKKEKGRLYFQNWQRWESNPLPSGYGPDERPVLFSAEIIVSLFVLKT
jgi:hypothetical protein